MTLTEFLLARIAEDEVSARFSPDRWGPNRRAAAEVEAKRRIVRQVSEGNAMWAGYAVRDTICELLALPYADHPDFREEWRVA